MDSMNVGAPGARARLARTVGILGLALVLLCPGLACQRSDRGSAERTGAAATQSRERPEDSRIAVWVRAVPAAYLSAQAPVSPDARQQGTLLSSHWLGMEGSVKDTDPEGRVVAWPEPLQIPTAVTSLFRVEMPQTPDRVDVRVFGGAIDAAGVPLGEARLVSCSRGEPNEGCRFAPKGGGINVELSNRIQRTTTTRFVLYAEWYVPFAQRPAAARSNATVSASWGFVAAAGPKGPPQDNSGIRAPLHPRSLRCSSVAYAQVGALLAPCARGAGPLSVRTIYPAADPNH
jgi:hypothetical protein